MDREEYCKTCRYSKFKGCEFCKLSELNEDGTPFWYIQQIPLFEGRD